MAIERIFLMHSEISAEVNLFNGAMISDVRPSLFKRSNVDLKQTKNQTSKSEIINLFKVFLLTSYKLRTIITERENITAQKNPKILQHNLNSII